jgi:hypothetical protein
MIENKIKENYFYKKLQDEKVRKKLRISALFFLGFLIGIMIKSQASRTILVGYEDYKILENENNLVRDDSMK